MSELKRVYQPIQIGRATIANRIVRSAHGTNIGWGVINDDLVAYHEARAKGGVGLSVIEYTSVHPTTFTNGLRSWDDSIIAGYQRLRAATAPHGMALFTQLAHGGFMYPGLDGVAYSSSTTPNPLNSLVPVEMSTDLIGEVIEAFGQAARRADEGGLQGVEIHSGHGYLVQEFLSPIVNRREDQYGGDLDNRMRFLREVLAACRKAVSPGFAIGIRISDEYAIGGLTPEDVRGIVSTLEDEGAIDFVNGSQGSYFALPVMLPGMEYPMASMISSSGIVVKGAKKIPRILTAARIRTLEEAEQLLRDDSGDLIVMNRAFIADPHLLKKTRAGREDEVRCCIACNQGCVGGLLSPANRLGCAINPAVGAERTLSEDLIVPSAKPRKVLVVGGGPGGMEAARTAALCGHDVTLAEAGSDLGGAINLARRTPRLASLADYTLWQEHEIRRLGVQVRTDSFMEDADILAEKPDVVIVATGSLPRMDGRQSAVPGAPIKGVELSHVVSTVDLLTNPPSTLPKAALIFDDVGHNEALSVAQWLVERGVGVTFATRFASLAPVVETWTRVEAALQRLLKGQFRVITRAQLTEIRRGESDVKPLQGDHAEVVPADLVVLVLTRQPVNELSRSLRDKVATLHVVGDARTPRDIQAAIREGHIAGRSL